MPNYAGRILLLHYPESISDIFLLLCKLQDNQDQHSRGRSWPLRTADHCRPGDLHCHPGNCRYLPKEKNSSSSWFRKLFLSQEVSPLCRTDGLKLEKMMGDRNGGMQIRIKTFIITSFTPAQIIFSLRKFSL